MPAADFHLLCFPTTSLGLYHEVPYVSVNPKHICLFVVIGDSLRLEIMASLHPSYSSYLMYL